MARAPISMQRMRDFLVWEYVRMFRHAHWHVGLVDAPIQSFLEPHVDPVVRWLPLPEPGTYYADPFGLRVGDTTEILLEVFDFRSDRGAISWIREGPDGRASRPSMVFDFPYHVSYPFLLERKGSVYCILETGMRREVSLYRAIDFPLKWTKAATLIQGVAALDSTVVEWDGMFWLMCTYLNDGPVSKLRIWYAPDLLGPWTAHPSDPAKTDITSARPAGTPFVADGALYRPAQDCSTTYGGAVVVNRILELTPTKFREERVATVGPFREGPYRHGIHTLSSAGDRTLVDGMRFAFNRMEMYRNLRESLGRRLPRHLPVR
jgi:hypothetical protein